MSQIKDRRVERRIEYWAEEKLDQIARARTFREAGEIALSVAALMPKPLGQVCGPISTGGVGTVEGNLRVFDRTVKILSESGLNIFNQLPLERPIQKIRAEYPDPMDLLNGVYRPLFENKVITSLYFIPGWESSFGARWEMEQGTRLGMRIHYLPEGLI